MPPSNIIQIKRSTSNAAVTGLSNGELAFTQASNTLFIGLPDGSGVVAIGGARYPGTLTANQALVANSSSAIDKVIVANAVITSIYANGAVGTTSQILGSNSSGGLFWRDAIAATNVDAQFAWTNTQTFSNTITFNGTVISNNLTISGSISSNIVPAANVTYNLGTTGLRYNQIFSSNVTAEYISVGKDLSVSGNLYVTGTVAYINTTSFSTTDSLLQFASNNTVTDILDIGFFGQYLDTATVKYTGLFRDATDGTYALFAGLTEAPSSTVNTAAASYGYASLKTYITSSALIANSTQTNITANSTVSVAITANTLNFDKIDAGTF